MSKPQQRVLTGVTTTGIPHLGNYVGAIRPAIKAARPAKGDGSEQGKLNAVVDDLQELPGLSGVARGPDGQPLTALEPPGPDRRLESARNLARENPQAMAQVVRGWMNN